MDDPPEPTPDLPEANGGAARRRSAARRKGAGSEPESSARPAGGAAPKVPRRWWEQPWLWLGVIVVVVGGAVGVSLLVNSDPDDITPSGDTTAFCASVTSFKEVRDTSELAGTANQNSSQLRTSLGQVQQDSPSEIRPTTDQVAAALDEVIQAQNGLQTQGSALDNTATADSALSAIDQRVQRASVRFARYVQRACGIDINATPPPGTAPTGTAPAPGSPTPTPNPSVSGSLVTPP
jgi:hypothetical protein